MKRVIVAFTGKRGHGKTTAAEALMKLGYQHINFADPLREVVRTAYGITLGEMLDPVLKEQRLDRHPFKSPREVLQFVGTDMFRAYLDDTWTKCFERAVFGLSHVVCSDLRFPNEAECVRDLGRLPSCQTIVIKIVDPRKGRNDVASQHASETSIDDIEPDHIVINDGSIDDLQFRVLRIAAQTFQKNLWASGGDIRVNGAIPVELAAGEAVIPLSRNCWVPVDLSAAH